MKLGELCGGSKNSSKDEHGDTQVSIDCSVLLTNFQLNGSCQWLDWCSC